MIYCFFRLQMYLVPLTSILRCIKTKSCSKYWLFFNSCNENANSATYTALSKLIRNRCYQHRYVIFKYWNDCAAIQEIVKSLDVLLLGMLEVKNISRHEQDSNLWGKIPLDFESNALTTRPSWPCTQMGWNSQIQISSIIINSLYDQGGMFNKSSYTKTQKLKHPNPNY